MYIQCLCILYSDAAHLDHYIIALCTVCLRLVVALSAVIIYTYIYIMFTMGIECI